MVEGLTYSLALEKAESTEDRIKEFLLCSFEGANSQIRESVYGGDTAMDTPVPIPNTAVKHREVEGTWWETAWETR